MLCGSDWTQCCWAEYWKVNLDLSRSSFLRPHKSLAVQLWVIWWVFARGQIEAGNVVQIRGQKAIMLAWQCVCSWVCVWILCRETNCFKRSSNAHFSAASNSNLCMKYLLIPRCPRGSAFFRDLSSAWEQWCRLMPFLTLTHRERKHEKSDLSLWVEDDSIIIVLINSSVEINLQKTIWIKAAEGSERRCVFMWKRWFMYQNVIFWLSQGNGDLQKFPNLKFLFSK